MLTKRMLDSRSIDGSDDSGMDDEDNPQNLETSAMVSYGAKAKTKNFQ